MAPARDLMGLFSASMVRPPLSACMTARIQISGIPNRRAAAAISPFQRRMSWLKVIRCSCWNTERAMEAGFCGTGGEARAVKASITAATANVARRLGPLFRIHQICPLAADPATQWAVPFIVIGSYNSHGWDRRMDMGKAYGVAAVLFGLGFCISATANDSVVTYHNGNHRHGAYTVPSLSVAAAGNMQRDSKFRVSISGDVYAQPLYWKPNGARRG